MQNIRSEICGYGINRNKINRNKIMGKVEVEGEEQGEGKEMS